MTHLEHIEIEGFKGLESLSFEPTGINVITGRNNTGKTSLLEAIELGLEPNLIQQFGPNVDMLVHTDYEHANITTKTATNYQTVAVRQPDSGETREILLEVGLIAIEEFKQYLKESRNTNKGLLDEVDESGRSLVTNTIDREIIKEANNVSAIFSVDGTERQYIHISKGVYEYIINVIGQVSDKISEEVDTIHEGDVASRLLYSETESPDYFLTVGELPSNPSIVAKIDSFDLADPPETENGEADAVKVDDIEEFLKEKEIVDDLRSFDLDYLVFEDDQQGKYSVPYEFMGDGFKAIVGLLWELLDSDNEHSVVLLEEPGSHMHPGYIRELVYFLVDLARTEDIQLFVTTHNNDFVSDFFGENLTDEERTFLEEEFTLVQLQDDVADMMSYAEAEEHLTELHLDLRGL